MDRKKWIGAAFGLVLAAEATTQASNFFTQPAHSSPPRLSLEETLARSIKDAEQKIARVRMKLSRNPDFGKTINQTLTLEDPNNPPITFILRKVGRANIPSYKVPQETDLVSNFDSEMGPKYEIETGRVLTGHLVAGAPYDNISSSHYSKFYINDKPYGAWVEYTTDTGGLRYAPAGYAEILQK